MFKTGKMIQYPHLQKSGIPGKWVLKLGPDVGYHFNLEEMRRLRAIFRGIRLPLDVVPAGAAPGFPSRAAYPHTSLARRNAIRGVQPTRPPARELEGPEPVDAEQARIRRMQAEAPLNALDGRMAECTECRRGTAPVASRWTLPFFQYQPHLAHDSYACGCLGWD